jgi:hypothetical protein
MGVPSPNTGLGLCPARKSSMGVPKPPLAADRGATLAPFRTMAGLDMPRVSPACIRRPDDHLSGVI